jgi:hypothetical protein
MHRAGLSLGRRARPEKEIAVSVDVLCPAERTETLPAIYNISDLERVIGTEPWASLDSELSRLRGGYVERQATIAFHMENVVLEDGSFYCNGWRAVASERPDPWRGGAPIEMDQAALSTNWSASVYFSHWLTDDLSMFLAAERFGTPVTVARSSYEDESYYADALNIYAKPLIRARFKRFVYLQDVGQNSFKRRRYEVLRSRLRKSHPAQGANRVFLRRGENSAARELVNEDELEQILTREDFVILDPKKQSTHEVAQACAGARIVLGVEGSQLVHGFMGMRSDGAIIAMVPPTRFMTHFKDLSDCIGLRYGMIVGTQASGGFRIDAGELLHLVDCVERRLAYLLQGWAL